MPTKDPITIRVVIADDEQLVREGLRMILEAEPDLEVVGEASDGREAISLVESERPDVVILDIRMPYLDGVEATRELRALDLDPAPRVLMVSTFGDDQVFFGALQAGASGFILKSAPSEELVQAVRVLATGESLLTPTLTTRLIEQLVSHPVTTDDPSLLEDLTKREGEVLRLIARGLSNGEIADRLVVSETTVKSHVGHIFSKLGVRERAQAVVVAYESGHVQTARPASDLAKKP
jgi:DNA-binding NarL/FixJ family response regulator